MEKLIDETLDRVASDEELCERYSQICAYATSKGYRKDLIGRIEKAMKGLRTNNIFEGLDVVESALSQSE